MGNLNSIAGNKVPNHLVSGAHKKPHDSHLRGIATEARMRGVTVLNRNLFKVVSGAISEVIMQ